GRRMRGRMGITGLSLGLAAVALALATAAVPRAPALPAGITVERRLALLGARLTPSGAAAHPAAALPASERAVAAREAAAARLSTWRDDSELALLNRAPVGVPFPLSAPLAAELGAARRCWQATGGVFDPTVGPLVAAWGLRTGGRLPSAEELERARAATGMDGLVLSANTAVRR